MESYEEFCLKSLARMHVASGCRARNGHMEARSSISFHGSRALLPRLSDQQRVEMAEQRQRAVQRETERHSLRIRSPLNQLRNGQDDEVHQAVETPCYKRTQVEKNAHSGLSLNRTTQRKETSGLLNSQMEKVGERGGKKGEEATWESYSREIEGEPEDQKHAEMDIGEKKEHEGPVSVWENESGRRLECLEMICSDCSSDIETTSPDSSMTGLSLGTSVDSSYDHLPSPPDLHSSKTFVSVPVTESPVHPHGFNYTSLNASQGLTMSADHSASSARSGVEWTCSFSDQINTTCHLFASSASSSLTSSRRLCVVNTTQPETVKSEKDQRDQCSVNVNRQHFPPDPLSQSYVVESPSPIMLRPQISSRSQASESCIRHRLKMERQKAASRLTAAGRGFLVRRLLRTEKIRHLKKIIQDSTEVVCAFHVATHQRRASFTMQDLQLQHRVRAQLHAARCDVHEIFFAWPASNRIALLHQDRERHSERRGKAKSEQDIPRQSSSGRMGQRVLQPNQTQNMRIFSPKLKPA